MIGFLRNHGWLLSWKFGVIISMVAAIVMGCNLIAASANQVYPIVWQGNCPLALVEGKDEAYARCALPDGKVLYEKLSALDVYKMAVDHKPLPCEANSRDRLNCRFEKKN